MTRMASGSESIVPDSTTPLPPTAEEPTSAAAETSESTTVAEPGTSMAAQRAEGPLARLRASAAARQDAGLRRWLRPRMPNDELIDLASNDYLGLAKDSQTISAAVDAVRTWGAGATGSRLVTGSTMLHAELEESLADFVAVESALVCSSGYLANLAAIVSLTGPDTLIISDQLNHASIVDACRLSKARIVVAPHGDVMAVHRALSQRDETVAVVVTDAVFSVEGDAAPISELHRLCRTYNALLIIDEAHSFGIVGEGRGAAYAAGLAGEPDVVITLTLSKALGSAGGAILGPCEVTDHVIDSGRAFIFDTALSPSNVGASLAALQRVRSEPYRATQAHDNARRVAELAWSLGLTATTPAAAVTALILGDPTEAILAAQICESHGIWVGCFRPPSVPIGRSCLRITGRADLHESDFLALQTALTHVATDLTSLA